METTLLVGAALFSTAAFVMSGFAWFIAIDRDKRIERLESACRFAKWEQPR